jgi:glucan phosphoethanolaminetransferase (alkaline phosphatase superfamily)
MIMLGFWLLMAAAALSLFGAFFHGVFGGKMYMDNINRTDLEPLSKSLSLVSWHVFTIFLLVGGVSFLLVGFGLLSSIALYPVIVINLLGALLFIFLGLSGHKGLMKMPGAFLMATTAACGYLGATWLV